MPRHSLTILGLEITFSTDADERRIHAARELIEERFGELEQSGGNISKEKLLTFLALSLADDYLETESRLRGLEQRLGTLVEKAS